MVDTKWKKTKNIDNEEDIYESFSSIKKTSKPIDETKLMDSIYFDFAKKYRLHLRS